MQPIIQHLFQASSLEDVSRQRLESFVAEYPSFGIGHFLLSRKLQAEGASNYMEETQKTNLYFTNPFWLQWLLESSPEVSSARPEIAASAVEIAASAVEPVQDITGSVKDTMEVVVEEALFAGPATEVIEEAPVESIAEPASDAQPESMVALAEAVAGEGEPTAAELLLQSIEEAKELRESLQKMNEDFNAGKTITAAEVHTEQPIKDEEAPFVLDEEVPPIVESSSSLAEPSDPKAEPQAAETGKTVEESQAARQTFVFEPYHTIDYFASQGIKLTLEENPSDSLGKQLKSFTDWLKVMRRLPQKEREIIPDRAAEQTVQTIAAHSVVGREVVTETMAEVLAKQGMPERARAVYEKLSLLNPDKRAYFATKIEQLNSH